VYVVEFPFWEAKPHVYTGGTFKVYAGDITTDPFVMDEKDTELNAMLDETLVLDVPVEHRQEFDDDIFGSLKDLAGRSTNATRKLIIKPAKLNEACSLPLVTTQQVISPSLFGDDQISAYINDAVLYNLADKEAPRFIHCDFSESGDLTGIGCPYPQGSKSLERFDANLGERRTFTEPVIQSDFVLFIKARPGEEIPLYKILNFFVELRDVYGLYIAKITTDGFQSVDFRQRAQLQGFETDKLSLDKTKEHHQRFRTAVNEGRWVGPAHPRLFKELIELRDTGKKFDHPDKYGDGEPGSKDGADGIVGSVSSAATSEFMPHGDTGNLIAEMEAHLEDGGDLPGMLEELLLRE